MWVFTSEVHQDHAPRTEFFRGTLVPCFELPLRIDLIKAHLNLTESMDFHAVEPLALDVISQIHDGRYLEFLQTIHPRWCKQLEAEGDPTDPKEVEILPHTFLTRHLDREVVPTSVYGEAGYYAMDTASPITVGAFAAARAATLGAMNAVEAVYQEKTRNAFSLSRPPGHHAAHDSYGGYCFLNHAAIAAQHWLNLLRQRSTEARIAILDVDFHHGNGTQQIFYQRPDVYFASVHGDPRWAYPYFLGHDHQTGRGEGEGMNLNLPLPAGTPWNDYRESLKKALQGIHRFAPHGLIISFGADTHEEDPISGFRLQTDDYAAMGNLIASLRLPTVVVMEGGYSLGILGSVVSRFLQGLVG